MSSSNAERIVWVNISEIINRENPHNKTFINFISTDEYIKTSFYFRRQFKKSPFFVAKNKDIYLNDHFIQMFMEWLKG